jgi:hypothetical protein
MSWVTVAIAVAELDSVFFETYLRGVRTAGGHGGCPSRGRLRAPQERLHRRISTRISATVANCGRIDMILPALFFERSSTTWWSCGVGLVVRDLRWRETS